MRIIIMKVKKCRESTTNTTIEIDINIIVVTKNQRTELMCMWPREIWRGHQPNPNQIWWNWHANHILCTVRIVFLLLLYHILCVSRSISQHFLSPRFDYRLTSHIDSPNWALESWLDLVKKRQIVKHIFFSSHYTKWFIFWENAFLKMSGGYFCQLFLQVFGTLGSLSTSFKKSHWFCWCLRVILGEMRYPSIHLSRLQMRNIFTSSKLKLARGLMTVGRVWSWSALSAQN